jgi:hypothetical protein
MKKREKTIINNPYIIHIIEDGKLNKKFRGIAKCNNSDSFDETKGMQIARLKAEIKREKARLNSLSSEYNFLERAILSEQKQLIRRSEEINAKVQKKYEELFMLCN